ncbi:hypothetical protein [Agrobacterium vitis]|uniref:hypothetical protein n=1 Tax=Agrobacterium vitis TaxID=373 RepID=UPI0015D8CB20|nr:hypothetical protein [Agrobacterium vitis]
MRQAGAYNLVHEGRTSAGGIRWFLATSKPLIRPGLSLRLAFGGGWGRALTAT